MSSPSGVGGPIPNGADAASRLAGLTPPSGSVALSSPVFPSPERAATPPRVAYDAAALRENLRAAIEQMNKQLSDSGRNLGISMDEVLNTPVITVRNSDTGEVVRQIPSEAVIRVAHTLESLKGLLHDAVL